MRFYKELERIEEIRVLLCNTNPQNKETITNKTYKAIASCLYYNYVHGKKDELNDRTPGFVDEILNISDTAYKDQLVYEILNMYDKWDYESHDPKMYKNLERWKLERRIEKRREYYNGLCIGLLIMFLVMLEVLLKLR